MQRTALPHNAWPGWRDFLELCEARGLSALPASDQTVALYLSAMADRGAKAATIARRLVVISQAHKGADLPSPTTSSLVHRVHAGVRRTIGSSESTCPVRVQQAWLETAPIQEGPIFRPLDRFQCVQPTRLSAERVALIVKRRAKAVGLDPARYAGHSLRPGLATSAAAAGASERVIM
jgi:hypothetical protein